PAARGSLSQIMLQPLLAAALTLNAPEFAGQYVPADFLGWLTNSIFVAAVVTALIAFWARSATRQMSLVPGPTQNLFEALVEGLYDMLEGIVGHHMIKKSFSLLATLFIFILVSNWFALMPGVGSIGWGKPGEKGFDVEVPILRPATADLNMTLGMAAVFMVMWLVWTIQDVGWKGFLEHMFGVKGGIKGVLFFLLAPLFFFVGIIEVISTLFRPISLSLRLFGNIFAGENLLTAMITLGKSMGLPEVAAMIASITVPVPFYFLEILVGLLQATVFTLLCAVYLQLSTAHEEEEDH
ncbi:MAG: F0F1 ATP synthase subunit A, partial [Terrimicrobiaceae bacterium]|nr:F0F1 ATP synthase subunit A [Terrimicrobiaceae bacterium]